jgi:hypothetical protein
MRLHTALAACAAVALTAACAKTRTAPVTSGMDAPVARWAGNFQPTQQRTGGVQVTGQNRTFGTVSVAKTEGRLERMRVNLVVAVPTNNTSQLRWALLPGRCGSGSLPLIGFDQFPLLEVSTNGRAELQTDLPLDLSVNGTYHVNAYLGGSQLDNVVTCANLRYMPRG